MCLKYILCNKWSKIYKLSVYKFINLPYSWPTGVGVGDPLAQKYPSVQFPVGVDKPWKMCTKIFIIKKIIDIVTLNLFCHRLVDLFQM